jgi:hypothetical protein
MHEPLNAGTPRLACEPFGCLHMHGMVCLCSAFEIEAHSIHHAISSGNGGRNRVFVVDIGAYRLKRRFFGKRDTLKKGVHQYSLLGDPPAGG